MWFCRSPPGAGIASLLAVHIRHALCESCALESCVWTVHTTCSLPTGQLSVHIGVCLPSLLLNAFMTHSDLPGSLFRRSVTVWCSAGCLGPYRGLPATAS